MVNGVALKDHGEPDCPDIHVLIYLYRPMELYAVIKRPRESIPFLRIDDRVPEKPTS
jgi:hypothetical protein